MVETEVLKFSHLQKDFVVTQTPRDAQGNAVFHTYNATEMSKGMHVVEIEGIFDNANAFNAKEIANMGIMYEEFPKSISKEEDHTPYVASETIGHIITEGLVNAWISAFARTEGGNIQLGYLQGKYTENAQKPFSRELKARSDYWRAILQSKVFAAPDNRIELRRK